NAQLDLGALGLLGLATAGFFWPLLFAPNVWMPAGGGDLAAFLYPTYHFAQEWVTRGVLPLWDPFIFGGMPFVGDIQSSLFYPVNLIFFFVSNPLTFRDMELLAVLHFYIAGAGMYALLRFGPLQSESRQSSPRGVRDLPTTSNASTATRHVYSLTRPAALAGAVIFEFSDVFITHFGNLNLIASASWLPLVFLLFALALERARTP